LLLNLLLGKQILPSSAVNCTSAITQISYGKVFKVRARKTNKERAIMEKKKEEQLVQKQQENVNDENKMFATALNKLLHMEKDDKKEEKKVVEKVEVIKDEWVEEMFKETTTIDKDLKKFLQASKEERQEPPFDIVEITANVPILESGITLTDSPGLNENARLTELVIDYLPESTGIICVINSKQGVTESLKRFLVAVQQLPTYSPNHIFWIVTHVKKI
jgi:hypothetical protein